MNPIEVVFWNVLFWALYLPIAVIAMLVGAKGHPIGILACGLGWSTLLTLFLAFQNDLLFRRRIKESPAKPEPTIVEPEAPEVKDEKMEVEDSKDKDVGEEVPNTKAEVEFSEGPEPRMQSDVGLDDFDADDDDSFSKCD